MLQIWQIINYIYIFQNFFKIILLNNYFTKKGSSLNILFYSTLKKHATLKNEVMEFKHCHHKNKLHFDMIQFQMALLNCNTIS